MYQAFAVPQANITSTKPSAANQVTTIKVGVLYSARGHRGLYQKLAEEFQIAYPNIKVQYHGLLDAEYKQYVNRWLTGKEPIDVMYWQAGERLFNLTRKNLVHPLNRLWSEENLDEAFPQSVRGVVSDQGNVYGLPFAFYTWGMFYSNKALEKLKIEVPRDWSSLLNMCSVARDNNIVPIMIATKDPWLPAAWFDYINLRLNGLIFHQRLLQGKESFLDNRVRNVFEHWADLVNADCFISAHQDIDWRALFPPLIRGMAASTLVANFADMDMPNEIKNDLSYFPFPIINKGISIYEDAPVDVFIIPQVSRKKAAAEKFIKFLSRSDVQWQINNAIGQSSPHLKAQAPSGYFAQQNHRILGDSDALAQYYDRDVIQGMVTDSLTVFSEFLSTADINESMNKLEALRKHHTTTPAIQH